MVSGESPAAAAAEAEAEVGAPEPAVDEPMSLPARLDPRGWPRPLLAALPPALIALALYGRTLMPGLGVWDNAEFQAIGPVLGIAHPTGYPTYTLVAWLASVVLQPFGEEALRANLLSALAVSGAVGLLAATVAALTNRAVAGIAAGLALAVAEEPWRVALAADPHALHVFFVALLLALLTGWWQRLRGGRRPDLWLFAAAIVYGLSLGNHALTILLAPGIAIFVFAAAPGLLRRPKFVLACVAAVILTTVEVYAYLPIRSAMNPPLDYANPQTWEGFSYLVFGEQFRGTFVATPPLVEAALRIAGETWAALGVLALLAPLGALFLLLRGPGLLTLLGAWFVVTWWFALGYVNAAIERYYLGPLVVVALLGGLGAAGLIDVALRTNPLGRLAALGGRVRRSVPEVSRAAAWNAASRLGGAAQRRYGMTALNRFTVGLLAALLLFVPLLASAQETMPRVDQSQNVDGRRWVESVLPQLEQDAVVVSWWSFSTPLWYAQFVEGRRPDVYVVDDRTMLDEELGSAVDVVELYLGQRPVYLIRLDGDLPVFEERFELEPLPDVLPMWGGAVQRVLGPRGDS